MEDILTALASRLKQKDNSANKGTNGTLTVAAGSELYRGAAALASSAALRCGVGIVRLVSVEKVISSAAARLPECVFLPTESENGAMSYRDFARKMPAFSKSRAVLAGCGMTDCTDTGNIIAELIKYGGYQLIIDADGLNSIKNRPELLKSAALPPVITPHIGEMARLTGVSADAIKSDREKTAAEFSRKYNCITVLKDCKTVISSPEGKLFVCDRPNAGLAKGGSGDVLSGIISSFAAQGYDAFDAAVCGTALHSLAAESAREKLTEYSMLPSDIVAEIPGVFARIGKTRNYR